MTKSKDFIFIFIISLLGMTIGDECNDIKYVVSKCYEKQYQWLIEIPKNNGSCQRKEVAQPRAVPCNFACPKGQTFDRNTFSCKNCPPGTFSLGGGKQYTFNEEDGIRSLPSEFSLHATPLVSLYSDECQKKELWQIKGNFLQGDVRPNCAIKLSFRFQLERPGSITIAYNLPTSYVFGTISSRCDFSISDDDDDSDNDSSTDDSDSKRRVIVTLPPTGYGVWSDKKITIPESGEYVLSLYTISLNAFHFPFAIRSIVVEGISFLQECIPCPQGTYASSAGSETCKPCEANTYARDERSTRCIVCNEPFEYADEGSSKCTRRPNCEMKHYQRVFVGCDKSNIATIKYEPIQPKICKGDNPPTETQQSPCGTCNPGMYKDKDTNRCRFCPPNTYSNGTLNECLPCGNELSLLPGLYYKIWNDLPPYLNRSYMSFDETKNLNRFTHSQSWVPSIDFISSQAIPDTLSVLSLTIDKGFRQTDIAKSMKEFGTLFFKFSIQCQKACSLFFVTQDLHDYDNDWEVIEKWNIKNKTQHQNIINYSYSIESPDEVMFNWLFTSDDTDDGIDEVRIYEISVTNIVSGGSDRCVSCLTTNNQETECRACTPGHILSNNTCSRCPKSTIASRIRANDPVPTVCKPCPNNTVSDDSISCYVPCKQSFSGNIEYNLNPISTIVFHGSKLFTQKGSGYYHVFNTSICGETTVTCAKTSTFDETKRSKNQVKIDSKLCRMGTVPDKSDNQTSIAYIDDFGEELLNISLSGSRYFPPLRSDYNLSDITLVYRADSSTSQSSCSERTTYLTLRCDHLLDDEKQNSSIKYKLQTPNDCVTGTCDGCVFHFLLRTPFACPTCDENTNGYRIFNGPCKFGHQEIRKIPYPYCVYNLSEKTETRSCSILSIEIQIVIGLFVIIASTLIFIVVICWRKNRKLEYRYMQLVENTNPDDDTPVDNVCAQISDEEDSGDEVQFKTQSRTKKIMNVVRNAIGKGSKNGQSESFGGESFLLSNSSANEA